jgi:nitrate reductase gamma subunit
MGLLQATMYGATAIFAVGLVARIVRLVRMPVHLRWDLYPIPHEKGRAQYGGSYYEEVDWWTRPRQVSRTAEVWAMAREIVLIQTLFHHNRRLWYRSFPFHIGMYALVVLALLLITGAAMEAAGLPVTAGSAGAFTPILVRATIVMAWAGWILAITGGLGLLIRRLFDRDLRRVSLPGDYVNLSILLAVFVSGLVSLLTADPEYSLMRRFVADLIVFRTAAPLPTVMNIHLWLMIALLVYLPFTHMTHFIGKYFTFHRVRWEDTPNRKDSRIEKAVTDALEQKLDWSAPHIKTGRSWAEAAGEENTDDARR